MALATFNVAFIFLVSLPLNLAIDGSWLHDQNELQDGTWIDWTQWASCSTTCEQGQRTKRRLCKKSQGTGDCQGDSEEHEDCNMGECPVNGSWNNWESFDCSLSCGPGLMPRNRTCTKPVPQNGGKHCSGKSTDTVPCNLEPCPVNGAWMTWSTWEQTCGGKSCGLNRTKTRIRSCSLPMFGGVNCTTGTSTDEAECLPYVQCIISTDNFNATFSSVYKSYKADFAKDGRLSSVFHSLGDAWEWLQMDLSEPYDVYRIIIVGRNSGQNRFFGYSARVGDVQTPAGNQEITWNTECNKMSDYPTQSQYRKPRNYVFNCNNRPVRGRFVTIQRYGGSTQPMQIGELMVLNEPTLPYKTSLEYKLLCFDLAAYQGNTLTTVQSGNVLQCRIDCLANAACVGFAYSVNSGACAMKSSMTNIDVQHSITFWSWKNEGDGCMYND